MKFQHRFILNQIKNSCAEKRKIQISGLLFVRIIINQIWTLVDNLDSITQNIYEEIEND